MIKWVDVTLDIAFKNGLRGTKYGGALEPFGCISAIGNVCETIGKVAEVQDAAATELHH